MLYCHPVWHILCHSEMVSHVPSFRQAGRLLLSRPPADDFLLCCHRLAVAIRTVPGRSRNMVFRTKLWHSLLSRMLCHALHRYFQMGKMWRKVSSIFYFLTPFLLLGGLFTIVVFHAEEILLPYKLQWECVVGGMSILLSIRMTRVGRWLIRKVDEYPTQNFSSDSDFLLPSPRRYFTCP